LKLNFKTPQGQKSESVFSRVTADNYNEAVTRFVKVSGGFETRKLKKKDTLAV
jgi:hypothetical protein